LAKDQRQSWDVDIQTFKAVQVQAMD